MFTSLQQIGCHTTNNILQIQVLLILYYTINEFHIWSADDYHEAQDIPCYESKSLNLLKLNFIYFYY